MTDEWYYIFFFLSCSIFFFLFPLFSSCFSRKINSPRDSQKCRSTASSSIPVLCGGGIRYLRIAAVLPPRSHGGRDRDLRLGAEPLPLRLHLPRLLALRLPPPLRRQKRAAPFRLRPRGPALLLVAVPAELPPPLLPLLRSAFAPARSLGTPIDSFPPCAELSFASRAVVFGQRWKGCRRCSGSSSSVTLAWAGSGWFCPFALGSRVLLSLDLSSECFLIQCELAELDFFLSGMCIVVVLLAAIWADDLVKQTRLRGRWV